MHSTYASEEGLTLVMWHKGLKKKSELTSLDNQKLLSCERLKMTSYFSNPDGANNCPTRMLKSPAK